MANNQRSMENISTDQFKNRHSLQQNKQVLDRLA
jgi:hypothetical protein